MRERSPRRASPPQSGTHLASVQTNPLASCSGAWLCAFEEDASRRLLDRRRSVRHQPCPAGSAVREEGAAFPAVHPLRALGWDSDRRQCEDPGLLRGSCSPAVGSVDGAPRAVLSRWPGQCGPGWDDCAATWAPGGPAVARVWVCVSAPAPNPSLPPQMLPTGSVSRRAQELPTAAVPRWPSRSHLRAVGQHLGALVRGPGAGCLRVGPWPQRRPDVTSGQCPCAPGSLAISLTACLCPHTPGPCAPVRGSPLKPARTSVSVGHPTGRPPRPLGHRPHKCARAALAAPAGRAGWWGRWAPGADPSVGGKPRPTLPSPSALGTLGT